MRVGVLLCWGEAPDRYNLHRAYSDSVVAGHAKYQSAVLLHVIRTNGARWRPLLNTPTHTATHTPQRTKKSYRTRHARRNAWRRLFL